MRQRAFATRLAVPAICVALAAMVWMIYGQTLGHRFVSYDDSVYVYENPLVKKGLTFHGLAWAFGFAGIGHWHPVTWLSHMLDCQFHGTWAGGHHLTNVLLHAASAILLFLALREMTGALWRSAFAAAVFAAHPLHVESVAWVAERKDVLSGCFFILTLWSYMRYARRPSLPRLACVATLYALGLMSKGMIVTLPFVLLLLDWWPLGRWGPDAGAGALRKLLIEKIPLFALSAASCVITLLSPEKLARYEKMPFGLRLENALVSCVIYLRQMIWPSGLAVPYPDPVDYFPALEVIAAVVLLSAISAFAFLSRKKCPWLLMGWLWYLVMLAPVIGIVQISYYSHADRYTYLPQIGLYVALAWLGAGIFARVPRGRAVAGFACAAILATLMIAARTQASYWKDDFALWNRTLTVIPRNATAENNLGNQYEKQNQLDEAANHYRTAIQDQYTLVTAHKNLGGILLREGNADEAIAEYEKAIAISPDYGDAHDNLGIILLDRGQVDDAISHFERALAADPRDVNALNDLGNAYLKMGNHSEAMAQYQKALAIQPYDAQADYNLAEAFLQTGQPDAAAAHFQKAIAADPDFASAHYNLAILLMGNGHLDDAISHFQKALSTQPRDAQTHLGLGNALTRKGDNDDAIAQFEQALEIQPGMASAHSNLAVALENAGRPGDAIPHLQKAIELQPALAQPHSNLGLILLRSDRVDEAIAEFQKAIELQPAYAEAHCNLGLALERKKDTGAALAQFEKALEIAPGYQEAQAGLDRLRGGK